MTAPGALSDSECVGFLQWALPRMGLRWDGFRRVRRQVCKRLARHLTALGISDFRAYRARLAAHPEEWEALDALCRVTISRFMRDRGVFLYLRDVVLPDLARRARERNDATVRVWCAGCASGEEPYTVSVLWHLALRARFPDVRLRVLGTDVDAHVLRRAETACYEAGTLRELPAAWREAAFRRVGERFCLREAFRADVAFRRADVRDAPPPGPFDLVLCRNLVFTYFDAPGRLRFLEVLAERVPEKGVLVLGAHEAQPEGTITFMRERPGLPVYRRIAMR